MNYASTYASHLAPGPRAVVIPADLDQDVRVIAWPGPDPRRMLCREIGCASPGSRTFGELRFWVAARDTALRALDDARETNARACWLGLHGRDRDDRATEGIVLAGTVVVTLSVPDSNGGTVGLARELADQTAQLARTAPTDDIDGLSRLLASEPGRGPAVPTFDKNGLPDGFLI